MFATVARSNFTKVSTVAQKPVAVRSFFNLFKVEETERSIPNDAEQQFGRRKMELDAAAKGETAFSNEPIIPPANAGTKENPILVPSGMRKRTIGFEHPVHHQVVWFNLEKGPLHFVPETGLYFKLAPVGEPHH